MGGILWEISGLVHVLEDRLVEALEVQDLHVRLREEAVQAGVGRPGKDPRHERGGYDERMTPPARVGRDDECGAARDGRRRGRNHPSKRFFS